MVKVIIKDTRTISLGIVFNLYLYLPTWFLLRLAWQVFLKNSVYFRFRESFTVLNLLPGSAILLKEVFEQAEATCNSLESKEDFVKNNLKEVGVKHLTYTQVHRLLISRIDWPKTWFSEWLASCFRKLFYYMFFLG